MFIEGEYWGPFKFMGLTLFEGTSAVSVTFITSTDGLMWDSGVALS